MTCNWCNIVSSHKCLTYNNQSFCTMSFNRKLIKSFWRNFSKLRSHVCFIFAWTSRGFLSLCHNSAQAMHGQFIPGSHLKGTSELQT